MQQITGRVIDIKDQSGVSKSGSEWQKRIIVIEYMDGDYAKNLALEMFGSDRIMNNRVVSGQDVTIEYTVDSSEWNGRWFTTAHAWRVLSDAKAETPEPSVTTPSDQLDDDNDLPF